MRSSKREAARHQIEGWLQAGKYAPGAKLPSILQMAKALGMSDQSVRKAVADLSAAGLVRTVNGVGVFAREPGRRQGQRFMVVTGRQPSPPGVDPRPEAFLDWDIHNGVLRGLKEAGAEPFWQVLTGARDEPAMLVQQFKEQELAGVISFRATFNGFLDTAIRALGAHRIVSTHWSEAPSTLNEVRIDIRSGIYAALDRALELGHRSLAMLYGSNMAEFWSHAERFRIFTQFCAERGLPIGAGCLVATGGRSIDGYRATLRLLDQNPGVTLIFSCNDERAAGVLEALRDRGRTPGREVSVIGYDDMPGTAELQLATIRPPREEVGRQAVLLLLRAIEEKLTNEKHWLEAEPVFRASLGPVVGEK
ncbi:MAG: GntR family transcriptional regulator [Kiritimatiellae bacterium]|nr:GntR family transcriptional regulator [Kiritimatiellia bacterium]